MVSVQMENRAHPTGTPRMLAALTLIASSLFLVDVAHAFVVGPTCRNRFHSSCFSRPSSVRMFSDSTTTTSLSAAVFSSKPSSCLPLLRLNLSEGASGQDGDDGTSASSSTENADDTEANEKSKQATVKCPNCDQCDGSGRIMGGIGVVLPWWPIKAYRPCPNFIDAGGFYERSGQGLDEIAFGRDSTYARPPDDN